MAGARREPTAGIIDASAMAAERVISTARILFCLTILVRSAVIWIERGWAEDAVRASITFPPLVIAIVASLAIVTYHRRLVGLQWVLMASVALDAVAAFFALLPNALYPWDGYLGLANMPDTAALLVMTLAAGFRLSPLAAAVGTGLSATAYTILMVIDFRTGATLVPLGGHSVTLFPVFLAASGVLAVVVAVRTRRLVERSASEAARADHATEGIRSLLRDHHDLRTLLTSATLNSDLIRNRIGVDSTADLTSLAELADNLQDDLREVSGFVGDIKERAYREQVAVATPAPAPVNAAIREAVDLLQPRFAGITVVVNRHPHDRPALVAGGPPTLRRVLTNLLANAFEGNGTRGATRVEVTATDGGDEHVRIAVTDNGPGFDVAVIAQPLGDAETTKPDGYGFGLRLVAELVEASGGSITRENLESGARVTVDLQRA